MLAIADMYTRYDEAKTQAERDRIRKEHKYKFSIFLELPYIEPSMFVVDPMHCFWQGMTLRH